MKAYVHYEIARELGSTTAPARLKTLEGLISPSEKEAAVESALRLRRDIKPVPAPILLQRRGMPTRIGM